MTTRTRVRLTARDYRALATVSALRAIRLDDLAAILGYQGGGAQPVGERTARGIVARWRHLGYATLSPNPRGGLGIVTATRQGADTAGNGRLPVGSPAWRDLPHTLTTAAVAAGYIVAGCDWTSDDELRLTAGGEHRPDGIATYNRRQMAVEVERTAKSAQRWRDLAADTLTRYREVAYWATPPVSAALRRWVAEELPEVQARAIRVYDLGGRAR